MKNAKYKIEFFHCWYMNRIEYIVYIKFWFFWWPLTVFGPERPYYQRGASWNYSFDDLSSLRKCHIMTINGRPMRYFIEKERNTLSVRHYENLDDVRDDFAEYLI